MKCRSIMIVVLLLSSISLLAQNEGSKRYLSNIVDLEGNEFGLIVGAQGDNKLYVVTATTESVRPSKVTARFYRSSVRGTTSLISRFTFPGGFIYLYEVLTTGKVEWQPYSYASMPSSGSVYSYLNNNDKVSDSIWYANSGQISFNDKISDAVSQLKIPRDDKFHRGMPVIDDKGRIAGIIIDKQDDESQVIFSALDIKLVQRKLDDLKACAYFQLIEFGQSGTPCDMKKNATETREKQEKQLASDNRFYGFDLGPAFAINYNFAGSGQGDLLLAGLGFSGGFNLYFSPDKGKVKPVLKPRFTYSKLKPHKDFAAVGPQNFRPKVFRFTQVEVPIMIEFTTKRTDAIMNNFFGLGYVPAYQFATTYVYSTNTDKNVNRKIETVKGFAQKVAAELGFQGNAVRVSLYAHYQFTPWGDPDYYLDINNNFEFPNRGNGTGYLLLGLDVSFRLRGKWGLKSR